MQYLLATGLSLCVQRTRCIVHYYHLRQENIVDDCRVRVEFKHYVGGILCTESLVSKNNKFRGVGYFKWSRNTRLLLVRKTAERKKQTDRWTARNSDRIHNWEVLTESSKESMKFIDIGVQKFDSEQKLTSVRQFQNKAQGL